MKRIWVAALVGLAVSLIFLVGLQRSSVRWEAEPPSTCMPDDCFCEQDAGGPIRQPSNTWSCFGFVMVGFALMALGTEKGSANPFRSDPAYPLTYGFIVIWLGLASMWFHASLTFRGEWADGMAMYLVPSFFLAHNLRRGRAIPPRGFVPVFALLAAASGWSLATISVFRKQSFALLVFAFIVSELWVRRRSKTSGDQRLFSAAFFSFLVAFAIWQLDYHRIVCSPASLLQGHAVWHLLCAVSVGFLFLYYRSERPALS